MALENPYNLTLGRAQERCVTKRGTHNQSLNRREHLTNSLVVFYDLATGSPGLARRKRSMKSLSGVTLAARTNNSQASSCRPSNQS